MKEVDLYSLDSVTSALQGQDAVVNMTSVPDLAVNTRIIDAARAAGVYRLIPADFGLEFDPETVFKVFPVFAAKVQTLAHLKEVAAATAAEDPERGLTWTSIATGPFVDWGLERGFLGINVKTKTAQIMDGGKVPLPQTTLEDIGRAVAGVLLHAEETKNRYVYTRSVTKSQSELLALAQEALGADGWEVTQENGKEKYDWAKAELVKGNFAREVFMYQIRYANADPRYSYVWAANSREHDDNELLGLKALSDEQLKEMIKQIAARKP